MRVWVRVRDCGSEGVSEGMGCIRVRDRGSEGGE